MKLDHYIQGLRGMDWEFEFSDDHRVWTNCTEELKALKAARACYDPDGKIWNQYAPPQYQFKEQSHA